MRIKQLIFCTCFSLFSIALMAQVKTQVHLSGKLKNFSNQVEVEDMSDLQYLLPPVTDRVIVPDTAGNFSVHFTLTQPNYFRLGRNILYLSPGDQLEVFIDKNNPVLGQFRGKGSAPNLYLRNTPFPKGGSFVEAGRKIQKSAAATIDTILKIAKARQAELDTFKGITKEFRRLETARVRADLINSLLAGQNSYRPRISADSLKQYLETYRLLAEPLVARQAAGFIDASFMKLVVYRDICNEVLKYDGPAKDRAQINDWLSATSLVGEIKKLSDKNQLKTYKAKVAAVKTPAYQSALQKTLDNLLRFGKGDPAVDFTAVDLDGKKVNLSSLKGKVIYVDLWATWCGPCMAEMPHYEELKEKYRDNPAVAFVSLSIDDGAALWKKSVESRKANGIQWLINRNTLNDYDIVSIPRSLLIDKEFKMVDMNAPMPSSKEIITLIDNLIR
jgi:thiol-disulfide isomerase/thioredoxin